MADEDDLALASDLVRAAGTLAAEMRRVGVQSARKTSVTDIVTPADEAAERLIVDSLRSTRPADGIVAEEGTTYPGHRTWFVDPIDGTYNYASGIPIWCSAVALAEAGEPKLGAIYHPATNELWTGGRGRPASGNSEPLPTLIDRPLAEAAVASYLHPTSIPDDAVREPLLRALRGAATLRSYGSGSIELAWVAAGRLGGFVQHDCLLWDWLPGAALVTAAGGDVAVVPVAGHRWHLAGSKQVVAELAAILDRSA